MQEITGVIYQILNTIDGKMYIGSTTSTKDRFKLHRNLLRRGKHHSYYLQNAVNLYGINSFKFNVLEEKVSDLIEREQYFINIYKPEYNLCPVAGCRRGYKVTQEVKDKISKKLLGKKLSPDHINSIKVSKLGNRYRRGTGKPLHQLTLSGELIKTWTSTTDLFNELKIHNGSIYQCLVGKRQTAGGYKWSKELKSI